MVNDLIIKYEGGIRIESELGIGTRITLILPLFEPGAGAEDKATDGTEPGGRRKSLPGGTEIILLVEDREKVRHFARRTLGRLGYHVLEAENADQALECLAANPDIDLLFTDIVMPGELNGRDLARQAVSENQGLKVLLTTGMEMREEADERQELPLLRKPYSAEQLATYIRQVLQSDHPE